MKMTRGEDWQVSRGQVLNGLYAVQRSFYPISDRKLRKL